ncbi:MAG: tetratricopeptide repeat protein, partial [Calothrix sp. SM1_7_51]|nr:tetratricopeptide repeat protein [Calothrix sp. SM1_7_51]
VDAHLGLAQVLLRSGDSKSAIWAYEQAMKIDPRNPPKFLSLRVRY